jgi:hypothetical protein
MKKIFGILTTSFVLTLSSYTNGATWQDVGTLASGSFPNTSCMIRITSSTGSLSPTSVSKNMYDLYMDFSNYTVPQMRDFFLGVQDNNWDSFYQSYQAAQQRYPNHVPKFYISVYKGEKYLSTSSMLVLDSSTQKISIGTPIPYIISHPNVKIQQLCPF